MTPVSRFQSERGRAGAWIAAAFALVLVAAALAVGRVTLNSPSQGSSVRSSADARPAPELTGLGQWFNSPPLTLRSLRGKVVLVDFWTFSCINCVRTIPGLRALYERYKPFGLEIVGVHSPEFGFEKVPKNVEDAAKRLRVTWPVAMDNNLLTWRAFDNHYWPATYFVDRAGKIRYDHVGEGDEAEQETQLRALLAEGGRELPAPVSMAEPSFDRNLTPEIYAGFDRGILARTIANPQQYRPSQAFTYTAPSQGTLAKADTEGHIYLAGSWTANAEFIRANGPAQVFLPFFARTVFFVAESSPESDVRLLLDNKPLGSAAGGDAAGGVIHAGRSDLYGVVTLPKAGRHLLVLEVTKGFALYTFTFG